MENRVQPPDAWPALFPRPYLMTGYLRQLLGEHFSQAERIENPDLKELVWREGADNTGLLLETSTRWQPQLTEFRPGVIIRREDWTVVKLGLSNEFKGGSELTGARHFAVGLVGSHTLFCIARLPEVAESLGVEVYRFLMGFAEQIRNDMSFLRFGIAGIGKLFQIEEAQESYAVPVTLAYAAEDRWKLVPYAPTLKRIQVEKLY